MHFVLNSLESRVAVARMVFLTFRSKMTSCTCILSVFVVSKVIWHLEYYCIVNISINVHCAV